METRLWLVHGPDRCADPLIVAILDVLAELWQGTDRAPIAVAA
jgi:hypothetical protein